MSCLSLLVCLNWPFSLKSLVAAFCTGGGSGSADCVFSVAVLYCRTAMLVFSDVLGLGARLGPTINFYGFLYFNF